MTPKELELRDEILQCAAAELDARDFRYRCETGKSVADAVGAGARRMGVGATIEITGTHSFTGSPASFRAEAEVGRASHRLFYSVWKFCKRQASMALGGTRTTPRQG